MTNPVNGRLLRGMLMGGQARALLCETTAMAQAARDAHGASAVCAAALGRAVSACALLRAAVEKETAGLTLTIRGDGPAGGLVAVAHGPRIKAYIDNPKIVLPPRANGKLDVGGALGVNGRIAVVRDPGAGEPYIGQCALATGEIAEDVTRYCAVSEQQPTLCALGVLVSGGTVLSAGGLMVQPLPGCEEALLSALELRAPVYEDLSRHLLEDSPEHVFMNFFRGLVPEILGEEALVYACDCSRDRMERALLSLGAEEMADMIQTQVGAELTCRFCNARHVFSGTDLRRLMAECAPSPRDRL